MWDPRKEMPLLPLTVYTSIPVRLYLLHGCLVRGAAGISPPPPAKSGGSISPTRPTLGHTCVCVQDDLARRLMCSSCEPLPQRRCRAPSPKGYVQPTPLPTSLWAMSADTGVLWDAQELLMAGEFPHRQPPPWRQGEGPGGAHNATRVTPQISEE
jgi:hypothetical protein